MSFIEMTGATLRRAMHEDELQGDELEQARVADDTIVRVNRQGDIEVRRAARLGSRRRPAGRLRRAHPPRDGPRLGVSAPQRRTLPPGAIASQR